MIPGATEGATGGHPTSVTPRDLSTVDAVTVPVRPVPGRRILRDLLGLITVLAGAAGTLGFAWMITPALAGLIASAVAVAVGIYLATER